MRLIRVLYVPLILFAAALPLRAEYIQLQSGQRLHVTSYQLVGDKFRLQVAGGVVEIPFEQVVTIEPEDSFASLPPRPVATAPFGEIVKAAATRYTVDADLINSVIAAESNFDPKAVSKRNARGLMQLLPETATRFGVQNIFDPQENVNAGTRYLHELLQRYNNDLVLTLAAYNAGPERVQHFGRVPPYAETTAYIRRVKRAYEKSKSGLSLAPAPKPAAASKPNSTSTPNSATIASTLPPGIPH